jgi:para-nitrobenzyl esterase
LAFAKTGAPQVAGLPEWPAYDPKADRIMDFTLDGPKVTPDPWKSRLDLAEAVNDGHEHGAGTK